MHVAVASWSTNSRIGYGDRVLSEGTLMTWLSVIPSAVVLALVLYLPGFLLSVVFTRRRWVAVGVAPLVSASVLTIASLVSGLIGGHWSLALVLATTVILFGVVVAVGRLFGAKAVVPEPRTLLPRFNEIKWVLLALLFNLLIIGIMYVRSVDTGYSMLQIYDTPFHFSVVRSILDSGDASSLHSATFDGTVGSKFYPALWHSWVALAVETTGADMAVAVNASVLVILCLVWPLSAATLTATLVGRVRSASYPTTIAMSGLFGAYPWGFLTFGVLYSNLFSYALAPAYLALMILLIRRKSRRKISVGERFGAGITLVLGFFAFAFAQPNSVFTLGVIVFPLVCAESWKGQVRATRHGRLRASACVGALIVLAAFLWGLIYRAPFMQRTVTWVWEPFENPLESIRSVLLFGTGNATNQVLLAIFVAIGLGLIWRIGHAWMVCSYACIAALYVLAASVDSDFRNIATGFWYHDSTRLSAALVLMALPAAAVTVEFLGSYLAVGIKAGLQSTTPVVSRRGKFTRLFTSAVAVSFLISGASAWVLVDAGNLGARRSVLAEVSADSGSYVNGAELSFMRKVRRVTGTDVAIANNPFDGSTFGYSMLDLNVVFKSLPGNWLGSETQSQMLVQNSLSELGTESDKLCPALASLDVKYVLQLVADANGAFYSPASWQAITGITSATPGFEEVLREGDFALYRVTGC